MYIPNPGTVRITLAVDPRHSPRRPSEATIPLATRMTETRPETLDDVSWLDVPHKLCPTTLYGKSYRSGAES